MTHYKEFTNTLIDRVDLKYSVYIAALDMQFAADLPYLWTFCFDMTGEVYYGRTFEDLREFLKLLEDVGKFTEDHKLLVYVNDLTEFFTYARTQIRIEPEPFLAKKPSEVLLFTSRGLEFRDFMIYSEKDIDKYIKINYPTIKHIKPDPDGLSELAALSDAELEYSSLRVLEITKYVRYDLDTLYQGSTRSILLTKTRRIERVLSDKLKRDDPKHFLTSMIYNQNPLSSEFGLKVLLPQLRKAFFGGTVFHEQGVLNKLLKKVKSADIISAYCAELVLSEFPMSKFKVLTTPKSYEQIFTEFYYTSKALLIQFEADDVELKPDGLAILPAAAKHYYIDKDSREERLDAIKRAQTLKLRSSKKIRMCLTDIDFKLFLRYYNHGSIKILSVLGARYGYLPDYIVKTVAELYQNKLTSKDKRRRLKAAGIMDPIEDELYKDQKTNIARLYGIFTQSPVVCKYVFDPNKQNMVVANPEYLVEDQRFRPVTYQWGCWTTARVREKLCRLRDELRAGGAKTISGDTDCVNYVGDVNHIISRFNDNIKRQIARRCEQVGLDPESLKELGELEVEEYKYYRMTSDKQYATIRATDSGDVFETTCGGMSKDCNYFKFYSDDPLECIKHFKIKLVIPSDYAAPRGEAYHAPRQLTRQCSALKTVDFVDRDGNRIRREIKSYQAHEDHCFTLCDPFQGVSDKLFTPGELEDALNSAGELTAKAKTKTPESSRQKGKKK